MTPESLTPPGLVTTVRFSCAQIAPIVRWTDMRLAIAILCAGCAANVTDVSRLSFQLDRVQLDVVLTDAAREDIGSTPAVESKFGEIGVALVRYD